MDLIMKLCEVFVTVSPFASSPQDHSVAGWNFYVKLFDPDLSTIHMRSLISFVR